MRKILFSLMAAVLCLGLMGGAFAYFSDVETSSGNTFTAGTIDLAVNDENPWEGSWEFIDIKPCLDLPPMVIAFENVGNNEGVLTFGAAYGEKDKMCPHNVEIDDCPTCNFEFRSGATPLYGDMEMSADAFASLLFVKAVTHQYTYEGYVGGIHDDLDNWLAMDTNVDGKVSLYELKQASPIAWASETGDTLPPGHCTTFTITWHLGDSLDPFEVDGAIVTGVEDNRPQADGIEMTITATLEQVGP